jgi:cbb3-type cytochrome oxidase cytochrome c subunit
MNQGPIIFLFAFLALAASWFGMVLMPQGQIGQLQPTNTVGPISSPYPISAAGMARQGLEVYRAQGCAYCHSQQVRQSGTACDVELTEVGTNQPAVIAALIKNKPGVTVQSAGQLLTDLPKRLTTGVSKAEAEDEVKALRAAGAKADLWIVPFGPDIARGYGKRHTLAEDFLYTSTVMPGSDRIGPDLANVGARLADPNWHLRHLYAPQSEIKGSPMPPYRYLFEKRRILHGVSPDALAFRPEAGIPADYEIIPTQEARALVAYLTSLRVEAPIYDGPFSVPPPPPEPSTNAAAGTTTPEALRALPATATNQPAK